MLNISQKEQGGIIILSIYGRVDHGSSTDFEKALFSLINEGKNKIVLDFSNFNYISSAGLRILLLVSKTLKTKEGMLVLAMIPPHIFEILEVTGLHSILNLTSSIEDGIKLFSKTKEKISSKKSVAHHS